ncbi:MAG: hypothetical protein A2289_04700 [Deltaproteobacteria bacterium RIFOXYA12_FULL_58_15]|nr:MAG: hypothetical protein A2289_04700 [Deltaproteobacteria bacterium RIFOXYA12_FULL_58_15]OGR09895.1 MAG: hypothetical protein A2341_27260 [Deltaproteobacteria bacterium RIFOXYB12_FULL_58_9]
MSEQVGLSVSAQFLEQLQKLPVKVHKKVLAFIDKFREDPKAASINYESLGMCKDDRVHSVRFGDDYRGIVVSERAGKEHLLVYVDHHDKAYRWAENKVFDVHPTLGSLQIVDVSEANAAVGAAPTVKVEPEYKGAFGHLQDDVLVALGLPSLLIPSVRQVGGEKDFDLLAPHLPEEVRDPLRWIVLGGSLGEAQELYQQSPEPPKNAEDFKAALDQPDSKRRFVRIRSATELESLLTGPLAKWRVFLHPDQEALVHPKTGYNGPVRVLGGAGTGKTVVAMHRARALAQGLEESAQRVLFTTFSKALAADIQHNLKVLYGGQDPQNIEVVHLHSWAAKYLKTVGINFAIATPVDSQRLWTDDALGIYWDGRFSEAFCKDEWAEVVQAQDIRDEQAYLRASRKGRGGPRLRKADREALWKVFAAYRRALEDAGKMEYADLVRQARKHIESNPGTLPYTSVIVDEAQDFSAEDLKLVRAIVPKGANDLFLVGDAHQRIYGKEVTLSSCGIDIRGRGRRLRVNYRTTHEIRQYAVARLEGVEVDDLDGERDDLKGYTSLLSGPHPTVQWFAHGEDERTAVVARIKELLSDDVAPATVCVAAPTNQLLDEVYKAALADAGIPTLRIKGQDSVPMGKGVRLCTMHRAKGLEFPHVLVAGLGDTRFPHPIDDELHDDPRSVKQHEDHQRRLLFVSTTRARDTLWVSGWGRRQLL